MDNAFIKLAKKSVQQLIPYEPGKPINDVARELGLKPADIVKLASNENPLGCSPAVEEAIKQGVSALSLYPDGGAFEAKNVLADHVGVKSNNITLGCGSDELLRLIAMGYAGQGDEVIFSEYAFAIYNIAALSVGATPVVAKSQDWQHDLNAMLRCVNQKTKIIYIANPNNPTGTLLSNDELKVFLHEVPSNVMVVLDEAYTEYLKAINSKETPSWIANYPNLVITRTFSKAYGLAGLRVGYAVANSEITDIINRVRPAFNVGYLSQRALIAALADQDFIERSRKLNERGIRQLEEGFRALDLSFIPSKANFIAVDVKLNGQDVFQQLLQRGVIVRPLTGYSMPNHLRVSVGLEEENNKFLTVLEKVLHTY